MAVRRSRWRATQPPHVARMTATAVRAEQTAHQTRAAAGAYEAAFAATVPPELLTANHIQLAVFVATNFFGQNANAREQYAAHRQGEDDTGGCDDGGSGTLGASDTGRHAERELLPEPRRSERHGGRRLILGHASSDLVALLRDGVFDSLERSLVCVLGCGYALPASSRKSRPGAPVLLAGLAAVVKHQDQVWVVAGLSGGQPDRAGGLAQIGEGESLGGEPAARAADRVSIRLLGRFRACHCICVSPG